MSSKRIELDLLLAVINVSQWKRFKHWKNKPNGEGKYLDRGLERRKSSAMLYIKIRCWLRAIQELISEYHQKFGSLISFSRQRAVGSCGGTLIGEWARERGEAGWRLVRAQTRWLIKELRATEGCAPESRKEEGIWSSWMTFPPRRPDSILAARPSGDDHLGACSVWGPADS